MYIYVYVYVDIDIHIRICVYLFEKYFLQKNTSQQIIMKRQNLIEYKIKDNIV